MFRNPKLVGWLLAATILATLGAFALSGDGDDAYDASRTVAAPASAATAGEMVGNLPDIPGNTFLTDDESNNIQIFSAASPSVAFVTNTQLRRQRFSLNVMEIPQGSGTGFVWDKTGLIVTNFPRPESKAVIHSSGAPGNSKSAPVMLAIEFAWDSGTCAWI